MSQINSSTAIHARELRLSRESTIKAVLTAIPRATLFQTMAHELSARSALELVLLPKIVVRIVMAWV